MAHFINFVKLFSIISFCCVPISVSVSLGDEINGEEKGSSDLPAIHSEQSKYGARNLEMSIRSSLKSRPSERFHRPEMSQIKAEISLRTNVKLICDRNVGLQ